MYNTPACPVGISFLLALVEHVACLSLYNIVYPHPRPMRIMLKTNSTTIEGRTAKASLTPVTMPG